MKRGLFVTVFVYTFVFLLVIVGVTVALFARQFMAFYQTTQMQQLADVFQPLTRALYGKDLEELVATAQNFASRNQSYTFVIEDVDGNVVFSTPGVAEAVPAPGVNGAIRVGAVSDTNSAARVYASPLIDGTVVSDTAPLAAGTMVSGTNTNNAVSDTAPLTARTVVSDTAPLTAGTMVPDTASFIARATVSDTDNPTRIHAVPSVIITAAPKDVVTNETYLSKNSISVRSRPDRETMTTVAAENELASSRFLFNFVSSSSAGSGAASGGYILRGTNTVSRYSDYSDLISKSLLALVIMLVLSIGGAFLFARQLTRPITRLADAANRMAQLEEVGTPSAPNNEIGQLARDMYLMYGALRQTIAKLKTEIAHERAMEEQQRYFFAAASHELKTPIAAASALIEGMMANIGDYQNHQKYLRECLKTLGTQNRLISEILEIVALSDDKAPMFEPVPLSDLIASILTEYRPLAERNDLRVVVDLASDTIVSADRNMLRRALSNVVANAVQNTPERQTIRVWTEPAGDDGTRLCVLNQGARIADTARPFESFYRADTARSSGKGRSGLGLTIVKKALERMRFPFALENTGDGVCFWVALVRTNYP